MENLLQELTLCTIVALVVALLTYVVLGIDKTWNDAFTTFFIAFASMFLVGVYYKRKNKQKEE